MVASLDHALCIGKLLFSHSVSWEKAVFHWKQLKEKKKNKKQTTASSACPNVLQYLMRQGDSYLPQLGIWKAVKGFPSHPPPPVL